MTYKQELLAYIAINRGHNRYLELVEVSISVFKNIAEIGTEIIHKHTPIKDHHWDIIIRTIDANFDDDLLGSFEEDSPDVKITGWIIKPNE